MDYLRTLYGTLSGHGRTLWRIAIARRSVERPQEIRGHGGFSLPFVPSSPFNGGRAETVDEPSPGESADSNRRRYD